MNRPDRFKASKNLRAKTLLFACGLFVAGCLLYRPYYYQWALSGPQLKVVVYCDTSPLNRDDLRAMVLYDRLALSPLAKAFGVYQNRPPSEVRNFYVHQVERTEVAAHSITLNGVPDGPMAKVFFTSGEKKYYAEVSDRSPLKGTVYVRVD